MDRPIGRILPKLKWSFAKYWYYPNMTYWSAWGNPNPEKNTKLTKLRSGWGRSLPKRADTTESDTSPFTCHTCLLFWIPFTMVTQGHSIFISSAIVYFQHPFDVWIWSLNICDTMLYLGYLWTSMSLPVISTSLIPLHPRFSPGFGGRSQLGTERVHNGWKRCH